MRHSVLECLGCGVNILLVILISWVIHPLESVANVCVCVTFLTLLPHPSPWFLPAGSIRLTCILRVSSNTPATGDIRKSCLKISYVYILTVLKLVFCRLLDIWQTVVVKMMKKVNHLLKRPVRTLSSESRFSTCCFSVIDGERFSILQL